MLRLKRNSASLAQDGIVAAATTYIEGKSWRDPTEGGDDNFRSGGKDGAPDGISVAKDDFTTE